MTHEEAEKSTSALSTTATLNYTQQHMWAFGKVSRASADDV